MSMEYNVDHSQDTQVVILDHHSNGPYFDVWRIFAHREPIRFNDLLADPSHAGAETNINVPLAGASNPMWQSDWVMSDCTAAPRRLVGQDALFAALRTAIPSEIHIDLQVIDFTSILLAEQLLLVVEAHLLIGVHGAGLTHALFMREGVGAIVELQSEVMHDSNKGTPHREFRNLAAMRGLGYYSIGGSPVLVSAAAIMYLDWILTGAVFVWRQF
ncbi:hypothetical protein B0H67DRAFT_642004 [Lasiosphaeris hirsuta]|uniref:EGF domain-specific O-linked N-acetylglucosamine transferase n=1 Tax=Lasiosphaeris hirsuta TaxID=260670 RepID=A0AA40E3E6_9PEZI|nr:hypothetical protein B0H67DRAFT_642004 [Lasiosphaeris hirsuta]